MTISVLPWATNVNYDTGPDVGTPTKVDPSSAANGFIAGTIAAPQHVNFLLDKLAKLEIDAPTVIRSELSMFPMHIDFPFGANVGIPSWRSSSGTVGNGFTHWNQYDTDLPFGITFPLLLPVGAILSEIGFTIDPTGHSAVPATRPQYFMRKHNRATGVSSNVFLATDPVATHPAYDALRTYVANSASSSGVTTNLLPYTGEADYHYTVTVNGESGANAVDQGLNLLGIYVDIAASRVEPLGRL